MTDTRIERDCLGEMESPNDRYYGIQTTRMIKVSGAAGYPVIAYPDMHIAGRVYNDFDYVQIDIYDCDKPYR